ncbi:HlyD family efflux transporter periplasmic adaptor subunit [Alteromonas lipolytica]|nr:HlyD family efflux transporter periplasmic adaptor subunit [Alteromonas lipolytica]
MNMSAAADTGPLLPLMRDDLKLYSGPYNRAGTPTWTIYDPARNLYFQIGWVSFEILCRWQLRQVNQIVQQIADETTLEVSAAQIQEVSEFLVKHDLVLHTHQAQTIQKCQRYRAQQQGLAQRLLHGYLFFRIPLWNPDQWLNRHLDKVRWLGSRQFTLLTWLVLFVGLIELSRQWDSFTHSFIDMFSLTGLFSYGVTLVMVKVLHELGHAFTARHFGCTVPRMGVAFLVMFPMAYTDVNDVWKLADKRQRLLVGAAGIRTELTIAAWSTLVWALLPAGVLKDSAFLLATTTWISTVLINVSPFMRFDGYFLLMDWLEMPNLHQRAFALGRWRLREWLFGLKHPVPEHFSRSRYQFLLTFSYVIWLYRFVTFLGIALMVYWYFPKPLGPILGAVEIYWFIGKPLWTEIYAWFEMRKEIMSRSRSLKTVLVLAVLIGIAILPWDPRVSAQGVLKLPVAQTLTVPASGMIARVSVMSGQQVSAGQELMQLESPDLAFELASLTKRQQQLEQQISLSQLLNRERQRLPVLQSQLANVKVDSARIKAQLAQLQITAQTDGKFVASELDLRQGDWLAERTIIGKVLDESALSAHVYLEQSSVKRVSVGDTAVFYAESGVIAPLALTVVRIDSDTTRNLTDGILASVHGGDVGITEKESQRVPEDALYQVVLRPQVPDSNAVDNELRGRVVIYGKSQSWLGDHLRYAAAIFQREAGF